MFSHTRRWYQFLFLYFFIFRCFFFVLVVVLCYCLFLQKLFHYYYSILFICFFLENYFIFSCSGMFRNVPCSRFSRRPTVYKFQASAFDELSFFPRAGLLCIVKCDEGRFSSSVFTSLRKPQDIWSSSESFLLLAEAVLLFVSLVLLFTASNLIFDLGLNV